MFDFLKSNAKNSQTSNDYEQRFQQIIEEANAKNKDSYSTFNSYPSLDGYKQVVNQTQEFKKAFLFYVLEAIQNSWTRYSNSGIYSSKAAWAQGLKLIPHLLKETELTDEDLLTVSLAFKNFYETKINTFDIPSLSLINKIREAVKRNGLTPPVLKALKLLQVNENQYVNSNEVKQNELINFLLQGNPSLEVNKFDNWGQTVITFLDNVGEPIRSNWISLFALIKKEGSKTTPSQKWIKLARPIIEQLGEHHFSEKLQDWLTGIKQQLQEIHKSKDYRMDFLRDENHEIIKGLIWCTGFVNDSSLNTVLDDYAAWAYKKKPGVGPISAKTGTAAMFAFSLLPVKEGVSRLSKFRMKIKNNTILKSIDRILKTVSDKNNVSIEEIEELSLPDFNIMDGEYFMPLQDCIARYNIEEGELTWDKGGARQKSMPAYIKKDFPSQIKTLKNNLKEIDSLLPVVKNRIEQSYLRQRTWSFTSWYELYHNHPLASIIARKLIWHFNLADKKEQGMFIGNAFINSVGEEITWVHNNDVQVQLWHPIGFATGEILAWRNFLRDRKIIQPFKQAFREVYIITDAELRTATYSNRFAAHILRQHQFAALCKQRMWTYQLMGNWDSHNTPTLEIPSHQITAQFYVNSDWHTGQHNTNETGVFNYIATDQVRFMRNYQPIELQDVPALIFSEVMRDVDLFVGVTSIGNDPAWQDGGDNFQNTYWREYSFSELSESAKIRSQVLETLIPQLKIASQCSFDKKFLIVKGTIRTYKIHMGSGNILMEPDDQYLCIVPEGRKNAEKVYLPFEGDTLLSIIISKALLLAADNKITDATIIRQIKK